MNYESQLGYYPGTFGAGKPVMLPHWVSDSDSLARAWRIIRRRTIGKVPDENYILKVWSETDNAFVEFQCFTNAGLNAPRWRDNFVGVQHALLAGAII